jgi:hypothetical protein
MGTGSFLGVRRPGRGVDHPPSSSAEVKERVEIYSSSVSGISWPVLGWTLHLLLYLHYPRRYLLKWGQAEDPPPGKPVTRQTVNTRKERKENVKWSPPTSWRRMGKQRYSSTSINHGARWRWMVTLHAPVALSLGKDTGTHWLGGSVGPRTGVDNLGKNRKGKYGTTGINKRGEKQKKNSINEI